MFKLKRDLSLAISFVLILAINIEECCADGQIYMRREDSLATPSPRLAEVLARVGPNLRSSADFHDYTDIKLNESIEAWTLLHEQARRFAVNRVEFYKPILNQLFKDSNASQECRESLNSMMDSITKLDSWAVKMWSFTGNFPPTGLFDGQFTDLGSYRGCVDLVVPLDANGNNSPTSRDYASYCVVALRPIVPSRRRFHQIYNKEDPDLLDTFGEENVLSSALQFAQYFHYFYMKTGVCLPRQCLPEDVQLVAKTVGLKLDLMSGPVKCFTRSVNLPENATRNPEEILSGKIENNPILVKLNERMNMKQKVALVIVGSFFSLVFAATLWHAFDTVQTNSTQNRCNEEDRVSVDGEEVAKMRPMYERTVETSRIKHLAFYYFSMLTNGEEFFQTEASRPTEIKCLHGLRALTMSWIICVHVLQYNDWSEFTRVFENVSSLQSPFFHPLLNANYAVDNFFLISGLLVAYTNWSSKKVETYHQASASRAQKFSVPISFLGRYLRLTPQVLLISLLYILIPLVGDGPFWFDMTHHEAKYCEKNWWVNLLHLQAFYRDEEMCNLVSWWISVDMFFYVIALGLLWLMFNRRKKLAMFTTAVYVGYCTAVLACRHYTGGYTPNNLGTVPQVAEVWTWFVVNFSWSPYDHAYVFFLGFWMGYILAKNKWRQQVRNWARFGWIVAALSMFAVNYSSHIWMSGAVGLDNQAVSTVYNVVCQIVWAHSLAWLIAACHYGCLPNLNSFLSTSAAVIMSKASFIVYLSHMLIIRWLYGSRYHVLEVSVLTLTLLMIASVLISTCLGIFLAIAFEGPCMKFQRHVVTSVRSLISYHTIDNSKFENGSIKPCSVLTQ